MFLLEDAQHTALDSVLYNNGGVDSVRIWTDTVAAPSSQISIVIDSEGYPHYAIGQALTYIIRRKPADNSAPGSGFIYSVEDDRYYKDLGIIYQKFGDINSRTIVGLAGGGNWDGEGKIVSRRPYSGSSRYPQLGIDANDNIYMVYTSVTSGDHMQMMIDTTGANANEPDTLVSVNGLFGHLYVTHKLKDFRTWSQPKDITPMGTNCLFGTLCDSVTDYMYIAYSANTMPGDRVTSVELPTMETGVYLYPFPVASLNTISNVNEIGTATADVSLYPNPTANDVHLRMTNVTPGPITVSVFSVQGERLIYSSGHVQGDEYETSLVTRNLATGSYQVIVEQNGTIASRTLSVLR